MRLCIVDLVEYMVPKYMCRSILYPQTILYIYLYAVLK